MRPLFIAGLALALIGAACSSGGGTEATAEPVEPVEQAEPVEPVIAITAGMSLEEQLAAARANWAANGPGDYDLVGEFLCEDPCVGSTVRSTQRVAVGEARRVRPDQRSGRENPASL